MSQNKPFIFYGDKNFPIDEKELKQTSRSEILSQFFKEHVYLKKSVLLDQIHSASGFFIEDTFLRNKNHSWFDYQGDFLITQMKNVGLCILTADCASIILYEAKKQIVGIVHSGWQGTLSEVVLRALEKIQLIANVDLENIEVFLGPSAGSCCYEVQKDFVEKFKPYTWSKNCFTIRSDKIYFDNKKFIIMQLEKFGIQKEKIYNKITLCTICNDQFCSFRREKNEAKRQVTVVALL